MRGLAIVVVVVPACSGNETLTCDLLAQPTNCWATAAAAAAACLPMRATPAMLAADRSSCTFSDGVRVVFDAPLPLQTTGLDHLTFTVQSGGATCAKFVDTFHNRMELTAGGKTVISELLPGSHFQLECDGGPTYETDFSVLFTCRPPSVAPTDGFDVTSTQFMFTITSVSTPGTLFTCQ